MLRISRLTDYAFVLLTHMARTADGGPKSARALADAAGLPVPTVSKVLKTLTQGGILVSQQGVQGGYDLSRGAEFITVSEVITTLEGPVSLTLCSDGPGTCEFEDGCPTKGNWLMINRAIRGALDGLNLAQMTGPLTPELVPFARADAEPSRSA